MADLLPIVAAIRRSGGKLINNTVFNSSFYKDQQAGSEKSANAIVPILLAQFSIRSVIDVGCDVGAWLRAFSNQGITDLNGLDGDYVKRGDLLVPTDWFHATDLATNFSLPRRYDLACSLEVAEHLPEAAGCQFVEKLCRAAPVVLFSAAIPGQGGTNHMNEAWQEVWRQHFNSQGYLPVDLVRWKIWDNEGVEWWYEQNSIVYVDAATLASSPNLRVVDKAVSLNVVHPNCYDLQRGPHLSMAVKRLPGLLIKAFKRRFSL